MGQKQLARLLNLAKLSNHGRICPGIDSPYFTRRFHGRYYIHGLLEHIYHTNGEDSMDMSDVQIEFQSGFIELYSHVKYSNYMAEITEEMIKEKEVDLPEIDRRISTLSGPCTALTSLERKTFIFDLDETLVHCIKTLDAKSEIKIPITF